MLEFNWVSEVYLRSHGWNEDRSASGTDVGVFRYDLDPETKVLVPRERGFRDYALRVGDVLHTLAVLESRPIWEVLETLLPGRVGPVPNGPAARQPKTSSQSSTRRAKKDAT